MNTQTVTIDSEFQRLLPDLDEATLADLEVDIVANGIREPLVVWAEQSILLDGHNRYAIATRNDVPFNVERRSFPDRNAAADWIDRNQCGRRNLTPDQLFLVMGRRYNRVKRPVGGQVGNTNQQRVRNPEKQDVVYKSTSTRLAEEHGVSRVTIETAGKFASAVESLKTVAPEIEKTVVSGKGPTRKRIVAAAKAETPEAAKAILSGSPAKVKPVPKLEEQRGFKTYSRRAAPVRAESAMTAIETSIECLVEIDRDELIALSDRIASAHKGIGRIRRRLQSEES